MAEQTTDDGLTVEQIDTAYEVIRTVREDVAKDDMSDFVEIMDEAYYLVEQYESGARWTLPHKFEVGDHAIDDFAPTPSPELNVVKVVELFNQRADEFVVEATGKTVAEHENNRFYPDDDMVVAGVYPNMDSDNVWHFPESRLR